MHKISKNYNDYRMLKLIGFFFSIICLLNTNYLAKAQEEDKGLNGVMKNEIITENLNNGEVEYSYIYKLIDEKIDKIVIDKLGENTNEIINKRDNNSRTYKNDKDEYTTIIYSGKPQFYKDETGIWWNLEYATTTEKIYKELFNDEISKFNPFFETYEALAQEIYMPAIDGKVGVEAQSSWALARETLTGTMVDKTTDTMSGGWASNANGSNNDYTVRRGLYGFDTSGLPDSGILYDSIIFSIHGSGTAETNADNSSNDILWGDLTSSNDIVVADMGLNLNNTDVISENLLSDWDENDYNDFIISTSTYAEEINETGVTIILNKNSMDTDDTEPSNRNYCNSYFSERTGTGEDPKLVVSYHEEEIPPEEPGSATTTTSTLDIIEERMNYLIFLLIGLLIIAIMDFMRRIFYKKNI